MDEQTVPLQAAGVVVRPLTFARVGSLRYFDASGSFASGLAAVVGGPMPALRQVLEHRPPGGDAGTVLAYCNPTETWVLCGEAQFTALETFAADRQDGCVVEQTGGLLVYGVSGDRGADLICRLGSDTLVPAPGEVLIGRLAELAVLSLCLRSGEIVLIVERAYAAHLCAWIRETLADF